MMPQITLIISMILLFVPESRANLEKNIKQFIASGQPNRTVGSEGHKKSQNYLLSWLKKIKSSQKTSIQEHLFMPDIDWAVANYQLDFNTKIKNQYKPESSIYKKWDRFTRDAISFTKTFSKIQGKNIIFEISGAEKNPRVLYIGAHYDTITHDKNTMKFTPEVPTDGADDNASSVAIMMNLIDYFALNPTPITLRFVFFDYEEIFFQGSKALAQDIAKGTLSGMKENEVILGLINLEMLGYKKSNNIFKLYIRPKSETGSEKDLYLASRIQAVSAKGAYQAVIMDNGFNRSDNWPFWIHNLPSVCVTQDWEEDFNQKNYHTGQDNLKNLNFDFIKSVSVILRKSISAIGSE